MNYRYRETDVSSLVFEPNRQDQIEVCRLSAQLGFTGMKEAHSADGVRKMLATDDVDLVFCRVTTATSQIADVIADLRRGALGRNQFAIVIAILSTPDSDVVRRIVDAGFDDIIMAPIDEKAFKARIGRFTETRKPFVVTMDYVGPDRRKEHRPGTVEIPKVQVPNPVRAMSTGKIPREKLQEAMTKYSKLLHEQWTARQANQLEWLSCRLVEKHRGHTFDEEYDLFSARLLDVSNELEGLLDSVKRQEFVPTLENLRTTATSLNSRRTDVADADLDILPKLAASLHRAFQVAQVAA